MGLDYYGILSLEKNCTAEDIKNAFRKKVIRLYPWEGVGSAQRRLLLLVTEAYEVLICPAARALYDRLGEFGLKAGTLTQPYIYHGDPFTTIRSFFGTLNPLADLLNYYENPFLFKVKIIPKEESLVRELSLTLEEIYFGGVKSLRIQRIHVNSEGYAQPCEDIIHVPIQPGALTNTQLLYKTPFNRFSGDVIVVLKERPHPLFRRSESGSDLLFVQTLDLCTALSDSIISLQTIDGRLLHLRLKHPISPERTNIIHGEGLPIIDSQSNAKGNLIISFKIIFPLYLSPTNENCVRQAFKMAEGNGMTYEKQSTEDTEEMCNLFNNLNV